MNQSIVEDVMKVRGVRGAAVITPSGQVASSNIEPVELNDFFELMFRVAFEGDKASALGDVRRIVLRTTKEEDLSLTMKDKQALALVAETSRPQNELFADIGALLEKV